jgi:hypothetical protein
MRVGTKQFERVSELMVRHEYQTVAGAAAVMSWLPSPERSLGKPGTRDSLDQLRALVLMKHGGDPYVVIQDYRAERAAVLRKKAMKHGFDRGSNRNDGLGSYDSRRTAGLLGELAATEYRHREA